MRFPVAIIGRAWRTPLGSAIDDAIARLLAGERAAMTNPRAGYACALAAPIHGEPARSRNARFLRRMGLYGMEVAAEALAASGVTGGPRIGLFSGVGGLRAHWDDMMAGLANQRDDGQGAWDRGLRDVHPYWMLRHLSNNVHALASAELGLRGEGATFGGGNGGAQALAAAARALHDGAIDAALVVAYDSLLEPETLVELGARRAATHAELGQLVAPYDARAAGYVPGEAAAAVVLVRAEDTTAAHAIIEATDGADGERAEPCAETLSRVVVQVVRGTGHCAEPGAGMSKPVIVQIGRGASERVEPDADTSKPVVAHLGRELGFVDGTARAWPELDVSERGVLAELLGAELPLTAITSALGQLGAATAVVQAIALAELLHRGLAPPVAGLARAAPGPMLVTTQVTKLTARAAIGISTSVPGLAAAIRVELPPNPGDRA